MKLLPRGLLTNGSEILQLVKKRENFSARNKKVPQAEAEKMYL
jgi:uncharacterized protein YfkK (UPF0435 family)